MNNGIAGHWWQDKNIELVKIGEDVFALHGWDGDSYQDSWKCTGELYMDASKERYDITPRYFRVSADICLSSYQVEEK
ncbi:hypothetical protein [Bacillus cereus]|uniref:Uncharacterized protein n=1 Tax=Bacillus cereus TIAC219 TaxID=718222 RepID=A0ABC9SP73_BACCE|nr:hypothetical protein [Bacillus cereus]EJP80989.1 hypothetical protein IC1_06715 [Bacillus cereus VD022]EOQ55283.1 hypothetical protein IAY_06769 [Bacillus cereus TIAC219]